MQFIATLLLFAYSSIYYYEAPTYSGISSLYGDEIWYSPSMIGYSGYTWSITFTGIAPFSTTTVGHSTADFFRKIASNVYLYGGLKHRCLKSVYRENTVLSGINYTSNRHVSFSFAIRLINLTLEGTKGILKPSVDLSLGVKRSYFIANFTLMNLLRPDLTISQNGTKSKIGQRVLITLNYPTNVYFSGGYIQDEGYSSPFLSTEVWFTHGFNVIFGIENHTVEGAISLRSRKFGVVFRVKSHTTMGATYIAGLSFYRE